VTQSAVFFGFSASVQLAGSPETLFGLLGIARSSETTNAENWQTREMRTILSLRQRDDLSGVAPF
jgi:hypothetical protein